MIHESKMQESRVNIDGSGYYIYRRIKDESVIVNCMTDGEQLGPWLVFVLIKRRMTLSPFYKIEVQSLYEMTDSWGYDVHRCR